ncbi:unnamed protein product [Miscanthus lutarioriparius]|uniref:Exocyst subunit Exo70 family protein n=1 Tax=Miscanthus lutarioriparius TaxID=422564 RepID=A0A811S1W6_9POAL|nr:unnamed protein product [Miscanthus lutarioriparius]
MEGWNGGLGSSWSYLQETVGSKVSSSSGTIVSRLSPGYASSGSRPSSFSMEAAMHFDSLRIHGDVNGHNVDDWEEAEEETGEERMDRIRILVQELFSAPSANCSTKRGDMSAVVERWLKELGLGWVLSHDDGASAWEEEELDRDYAWTWIRALDQIAQTICFMRPHFPDCGSVGLPGICEEQGKIVPNQYHLARFIQETMLKMLAFVDAVVAWDPYTTEEFLSMDLVMLQPYSKLINLLDVYDALSEASDKILMMFNSPTSVEVQRIENEMAILLSAYKSKLGEAIRSIMEKIRTKLLEDGDTSSTSLNPQGSSDIHKATRSVMTYIRFLWFNYSSVDAAISGKCVSHIENVLPLDNMIIEMVSCLLEKLANISESFPDQGIRFLFLLNNSYFLLNSQSSYRLQRPWLPVDLNDQIEDYMERYLQVSWAPLLSFLFNTTPLCLGKNYSPLSKFESEFQKMYTTQKHWKVSDPELRRRLREVITDKIIPGYTEYIEDNKVTNPKFSPQELKAMLQELFEG